MQYDHTQCAQITFAFAQCPVVLIAHQHPTPLPILCSLKFQEFQGWKRKVPYVQNKDTRRIVARFLFETCSTHGLRSGLGYYYV